ncbi:putative nepenthesin [Dioscorea sansibarensis]
MASHPFIIFFYGFALFLFLLSSPSFIHYSFVAGEISGDYQHVVKPTSLLPAPMCLPTKESTVDGTRLKLVHQHGACSPLKHTNKLDHKQILAQDQYRVNFIQNHRRSSTTTINLNKTQISPITETKIPAYRGNSFSTSNYIVKISFGTPKHDFTVIFDTGSDVTWIQCQPCAVYCYPQKEPIFDPTQSSTYSNVSCSAPACAELDRSGCSGSTCLYGVLYGDNSSTVGIFAKDTLTLSSSDIIPGFFFGCGEKNKGLFGETAGILGLGRGATSLISQSKTKYNGIFSYCLPSTTSSAGYLTFGAGAPANFNCTPMLTDSSMPTFYFLGLQSIIVAGTKLPISPTVFSKAGTLIDSGTVISRLPPEAYSSLRKAFRQKMAKYPSAPAFQILDTCYDLSSYETVDIPTVAFGFADDLVVDLDVLGILFVNSLSQVCLAFAGNGDAGDTGIIGNIQQRKLGVVYDVGNKVIGFAQGACN